MNLQTSGPAAKDGAGVLLAVERLALTTSAPKKPERRKISRLIVIRPVTGGFTVAVEPHPAIKRNAVGFNRRLDDVGAARSWAAEVHALKGWEVSDLAGDAVAADPVIVPLEDLDENHRAVHDYFIERFARDAFRDARRRP